jgi:NitT/TauT family transport system permease protein
VGSGGSRRNSRRAQRLGYLLNDAYQFYRNDVVIAAMISIGALGFLSDLVIVAIRNRVLQWNQLEVFSGKN